ncbi:MAG: CPBP family intramembrane metalloprotease [Gammaproteobacteria bacterium]|jgi:uncharacterized protein|nr:CPBP family intramembrane metalloprotease [Gammaproteobacteria bacterium]MBU0771058.1 CPBP family intramembrane metalloprotease [Gammaproteobacteria bacterium]MBU0854639.1 CPBP family intramembrane metalloprotease [Gammaproteobacteria bacterium]MBU1845971.1 CPBP family intramembrane metalloprotease [Gammaproteobacteria bacterium]
MREQHKDFPSALESVFVIVALFAAEMLVGAALHDVGALADGGEAGAAAFIMLASNGLLLSAVMHYKNLGYRSLMHASDQPVGTTLGLLSLPILLLAPALMLGMNVIVALVQAAFPMSAPEQAMFDRYGAGGIAMFVMVCVLAPVVEEMLFRGVILRSFLHQYPRGFAIAASSVLFGLAHMNVYQFTVALVLGVSAGWLYERTRSLWPCIVLHAAYNSASFWTSLLATGPGHFGSSGSDWAIALLLAAVGAHRLRRALVPERPV